MKYAIGLNAFHSKKRNLQKQEIYARVLFFNMTSLLTGNKNIEDYVDMRNKEKSTISQAGMTSRMTTNPI